MAKVFSLETMQMEEVEEEFVVNDKEFKKEKKISPFEFIDNITKETHDMMTSINAMNDYLPFMVNRGLAMTPDTLFYANAMNTNYHLDKDLQYNYLRHSIKKRNRPKTWVKEEKLEDINNVMEYYQVSRLTALDYLNILTDSQKSEIELQLKRAQGIVV